MKTYLCDLVKCRRLDPAVLCERFIQLNFLEQTLYPDKCFPSSQDLSVS